MDNWVYKYIRQIFFLLIIMLLAYITIFYYYLKFDLGLEKALIDGFFTKYIWLFLIIAFLFLGLIYILMMKFLKPIKDIVKTSESILNRRIFLDFQHLNGKKKELQIAGAMSQLAENFVRQLTLLHENDLRLNGIIENMSSGVIYVTKDRKIALINHAIEELFEYSSKYFIGKHHIEALRHAVISESLEKSFTTREKIKREVTLFYPKEKTLLANFAPVKSDNSELLGVVILLNDISDIKRIEKIRTDFVANASHELKTPVTSIKGFAETLLDGAYKEEGTNLHFLTIIKNESDRLLRIVNDLLDLSKIESNNVTLELESFNLKRLIHLLLQSFEAKISEQELKITINVDDELNIKADKSKLSQIFVNLLNNAIMYTPKGGDIKIGCEDKDNHYEIYVEDTGIGIELENIDRIFERFYRIDKSRVRAKGGTGLGLSIVKHLVEAHEGKINVQSKVGKGTKFTIHLPKK